LRRILVIWPFRPDILPHNQLDEVRIVDMAQRNFIRKNLTSRWLTNIGSTTMDMLTSYRVIPKE